MDGAYREIKVLQSTIKSANKAIKRYKATLKEHSTEYGFECYTLPLLEAKLTKEAAIYGITYISKLGKEDHKKTLLASILSRAANPSRSTSPMINLHNQTACAVDANVYSKIYNQTPL